MTSQRPSLSSSVIVPLFCDDEIGSAASHQATSWRWSDNPQGPPHDRYASRHISIEIEKDRVVRCARNCFGAFAQALNNCRKRRGSVADTAVRVISIAEPRRHPRNRHIPAEQACGFDPPRDDFGKACCDSWPFELAICVVDYVGEAIIWQDVLLIHGSVRMPTLVRPGD